MAPPEWRSCGPSRSCRPNRGQARAATWSPPGARGVLDTCPSASWGSLCLAPRRPSTWRAQRTRHPREVSGTSRASRRHLAAAPARAQRGGLHDRELDQARLPWRVEHPLGRLPVVGRLRPEDVLDERLGVPVVQREPAGLHLDHHPVPGQEHVVHGGQLPPIGERLVRRDGSGTVGALAVPSAEDVGRRP